MNFALTKRLHKNTRELEAQIDKMVYKLYGLTEEEVKVVEEKG